MLCTTEGCDGEAAVDLVHRLDRLVHPHCRRCADELCAVWPDYWLTVDAAADPSRLDGWPPARGPAGVGPSAT